MVTPSPVNRHGSCSGCRTSATMQSTVSIEIQMPQDLDLTDVVADEVEGWTITATTRDGDIVDTITWDATGPGLVGEDSVELPVAVGPLPAVESLTFPTVQTYDDGEVVRWIEPAPPGEPEPELPVPTLEITPASPDATTAPSAAPTAPEPVETEPDAHGGHRAGDERDRRCRRAHANRGFHAGHCHHHGDHRGQPVVDGSRGR